VKKVEREVLKIRFQVKVAHCCGTTGTASRNIVQFFPIHISRDTNGERTGSAALLGNKACVRVS
jgi:hypothetical protein